MENNIKKEILASIKEVFDIDLDDIKLSVPPKKELGDFAFNCGILARDLKKNPMLIAEELLESLNKIDLIENASNDGAFINLKIDNSIFTEKFKELYKNNNNFSDLGKGEKIIIDYIGANVGKPLHIGHMCTPNQGQAMINVYKKLGYEVISDSHIGDWGIIFGKLITAYKLWGEEEKLKENAVNYLLELYIKITAEAENDNKTISSITNSIIKYLSENKYNLTDEFSNGKWKLIVINNDLVLLNKLFNLLSEYNIEQHKYFTDIFNSKFSNLEQKTRDEFKLLSEGDSESVELWKKFTSYSISAMNKQLSRLNVKPDFNIGESFYEGLGLPKMEDYPDLKYPMHSIVEELIEKGVATKNEDNSVGVEFSEELKMPSCILQKRDGTHGYLASDLAAIKYRSENWNPAKIVYFVDSRQQMHLKQAFTIAKKAGWLNETELFHAYNGFISLKDGAMSTRKGRIIKLDSLLDEAETRAEKIILEKRDDISGDELKNLSKIIGVGAIKYGYLKKSRETDVIFDWDEFMSFEGNSGPYIQYAYVRAIRMLEKSEINLEGKEINSNFEESDEIELVKILSNFRNTLIQTSEKNTPHLVCKYSYDLTKAFNSFYNNIRVLNEENEDKKLLRLMLVKLFSETLKESFNLLGIDMPEKM